MPRLANLGSDSWYIAAYVPATNPMIEPLLLVGNRLASAVSHRALFQMCWLQFVPPGPLPVWVGVPEPLPFVPSQPNGPALFMYSPKNVPSPAVASCLPTKVPEEFFPSGRLATPDDLVPVVM